MSTVSDLTACPQCGCQAEEEFNSRDCTLTVFCRRCGFRDLKHWDHKQPDEQHQGHGTLEWISPQMICTTCIPAGEDTRAELNQLVWTGLALLRGAPSWRAVPVFAEVGESAEKHFTPAQFQAVTAAFAPFGEVPSRVLGSRLYLSSTREAGYKVMTCTRKDDGSLEFTPEFGDHEVTLSVKPDGTVMRHRPDAGLSWA